MSSAIRDCAARSRAAGIAIDAPSAKLDSPAIRRRASPSGSRRIAAARSPASSAANGAPRMCSTDPALRAAIRSSGVGGDGAAVRKKRENSFIGKLYRRITFAGDYRSKRVPCAETACSAIKYAAAFHDCPGIPLGASVFPCSHSVNAQFRSAQTRANFISSVLPARRGLPRRVPISRTRPPSAISLRYGTARRNSADDAPCRAATANCFA